MIILLRCVFGQEAELKAASKFPGGAAESLAAISPDFAAAPSPFHLCPVFWQLVKYRSFRNRAKARTHVELSKDKIKPLNNEGSFYLLSRQCNRSCTGNTLQVLLHDEKVFLFPLFPKGCKFVVLYLINLLSLFGSYLDPLSDLLIFGKSTLGFSSFLCALLPKISYIVLDVLTLHTIVCNI